MTFSCRSYRRGVAVASLGSVRDRVLSCGTGRFDRGLFVSRRRRQSTHERGQRAECSGPGETVLTNHGTTMTMPSSFGSLRRSSGHDAAWSNCTTTGDGTKVGCVTRQNRMPASSCRVNHRGRRGRLDEAQGTTEQYHHARLRGTPLPHPRLQDETGVLPRGSPSRCYSSS